MANQPKLFDLPTAARSVTEAVTKDWAKQRKAEERNRNAILNRRDRLISYRSMYLKEAAEEVMETAYLAASDNGKLPVKARQIMYAARPKILELTGKDHLDDAYFTQTLLPDYMEAHDCSDWDVVWDARGTFTEPHTDRSVPLGTLEVRQYLGERPEFNSEVDIAEVSLFDTTGPENRYRTVLFIEKEGFWPLLQAAHIAERFDLALMSTKGMSTTAARMLLDRLVARGVEKVLVLHDFDVSGFSILGTLGTGSRRYFFDNKIPVIDLGLRLADAEAMDLGWEPVSNHKDWNSVVHTLKRHGATPEEIDFLYHRRIELNAMTSRQFIDFLEQKFDELGITKVIPPDDDVIAEHARRVIKHRLIERASDKFTKQAAAAELPADLREQIERLLKEHPELPWDAAVALVIAAVER